MLPDCDLCLSKSNCGEQLYYWINQINTSKDIMEVKEKRQDSQGVGNLSSVFL